MSVVKPATKIIIMTWLAKKIQVNIPFSMLTDANKSGGT